MKYWEREKLVFHAGEKGVGFPVPFHKRHNIIIKNHQADFIMLVAFFSRECNSPLCLRRRSLILFSRNSQFLCKISSSYTFGVLNSQPGLINKLTSLQSTIISSLSLVSRISGERLSWLYLNSKLKKLVLMT